MSIVYIYGLVDPRNELTIENVRYVGKTKRSVVKRHKQHLRDSKKYNTPINNWIRELLDENLTPQIIELDVCDLNCWRSMEKKYIYKLRKTNNLLNVSDGGYGIEDKSRLVRVFQYDELGNKIKSFDSIANAAYEMNVVPSTISGALDQNFSKSSCGYYWFTSKQNAKKFQFVRPRQFQKPIVAYDLNGFLFNEYTNISKASENLEIHKSNIIHSISSNGTCMAGNYLWFYMDNIPKDIKPYHRNGLVSVIQKTMDGKYIDKFESISDASRKTGVSYGVIFRNIKGDNKSYDYFKWEKIKIF